MKLTNLTRRLAVLPVLLLVACQASRPGLFAQKYMMDMSTDAPGLVQPPKGYEPQFIRTDDMSSVIDAMLDQGYVMIGHSVFNSAEAGTNHLGQRFHVGDPVAAARWAKAEVVYLQSGYSHSKMETVEKRIKADEIRTRRDDSGSANQQSSRVAQGSEYGSSADSQRRRDFEDSKSSGWNIGGKAGVTGKIPSGGIFGGYGSDKSSSQSGSDYDRQSSYQRFHRDSEQYDALQTYRDSSVYSADRWATRLIDQEVDHYDYFATFWKRRKPSPLGIMAETPPTDVRRVLGTNSALTVTHVLPGSAAYRGNLFAGDILLALDGQELRDGKTLKELVNQRAGETVTLTLVRDGMEVTAEVDLDRVKAK